MYTHTLTAHTLKHMHAHWSICMFHNIDMHGFIHMDPYLPSDSLIDGDMSRLGRASSELMAG